MKTTPRLDRIRVGAVLHIGVGGTRYRSGYEKQFLLSLPSAHLVVTIWGSSSAHIHKECEV